MNTHKKNHNYLLSRNKQLLLFAAFFLTVHFSYAEKAKLHLIVFSAENDPLIGQGCKLSRENIVSEIETVEEYCDLDVETYVFNGKASFTKAELRACFSSMVKSNDNDVIMFFYTGHGFRYEDTRDRWPYLLLFPTNDVSRDELVNSSISLTDVQEMMRLQNARLKITISESCNTPVSMPTPSLEKKGEGTP